MGSISPVPARALVAWVWVTLGAAMVHSVPPLNSMPRLRPPRRMIEMTPSEDDDGRDGEPDAAPADEVEAGLTPVEAGDRAVALRGLGQEGAGGVVERDELVLVEVLGVDALLELLDLLLGHVVEGAAVVVGPLVARAHEPPPAMAPLGTAGGLLAGLRAGVQPGADAEDTRTLEPLTLTQQDDERPGVEPGDRHVHDGREAEEEGESLHVPDGDEIEHDGGEQRDEVGRPHRPPGALEAAVHRGAHGAAGSGLVLEAFEIDDVRVDGDADGDDQTGDAGQVEARGDRGMAERRDDGPEQCRR